MISSVMGPTQEFPLPDTCPRVKVEDRPRVPGLVPLVLVASWRNVDEAPDTPQARKWAGLPVGMLTVVFHSEPASSCQWPSVAAACWNTFPPFDDHGIRPGVR